MIDLYVSGSARLNLFNSVIQYAVTEKSRALSELDKRKKAAEAKTKEGKQMKALDNLLPLLVGLIDKVIQEWFCAYFANVHRLMRGYEITSFPRSKH